MEGGGGDVSGAADGGDYGGYGGDYGGEFGGVGGDMGGESDFGLGYSLDPGFTDFAADPGFDPAGAFGFDPSSLDNSNVAESEDGFGKKAYGWMQSPLGKAFGMALGIANPGLGAAYGLGRSALGISQGQYGPAMGMAAGRAAAAAGLGPVGSLAAGYAGGLAGKGMSSGEGVGGLGSAAMGNTSTGSMGGMDNLFGGLGALYQGYTNSKDIGGQIGNLQSLYGQDSAYSQTLRQQLERRDAASGRRSQYGPREVELQAALAGLNSRNAPMLAQLYNQKMLNRQKMLQAAMFGYQQLGGWNGLSSLFGGGGGQGVPGLADYQYQLPQMPDWPIPEVPVDAGDNIDIGGGWLP